MGEPDLPEPEKPTDAKPGSEEKILAMMARLERGEQLHHALDKKDQHAWLPAHPCYATFGDGIRCPASGGDD